VHLCTDEEAELVEHVVTEERKMGPGSIEVGPIETRPFSSSSYLPAGTKHVRSQHIFLPMLIGPYRVRFGQRDKMMRRAITQGLEALNSVVLSVGITRVAREL
jgi:hypothetical protein